MRSEHVLDTSDDPEGKWDGNLHEVLRATDLLFCTEEELVRIGDIDDPQAAAACLAARIPVLVVKRRSLGASACTGGQRFDSEAYRVAVKDAVGAGDTFNAGFLHRWLRGPTPETCISYGNLAAALSVTRPGGIEAFRDAAYWENFLSSHPRKPSATL